MRRASLLLAVLALALVVASGVALAATINGNEGNNRLVGTKGKDNISGGGGNDDIFGKGGRDRLFGDSGNDAVLGGSKGDRFQGGLGQDRLFGQGGNDFANAIDKQINDRINCGTGNRDVAGFDDRDNRFGNGNEDQVAQNCELWYVAFGGVIRAAATGTSDSEIDLSRIDTIEEAEAAEADGLLKQIR
jgi:hypothetical protein